MNLLIILLTSTVLAVLFSLYDDWAGRMPKERERLRHEALKKETQFGIYANDSSEINYVTFDLETDTLQRRKGPRVSNHEVPVRPISSVRAISLKKVWYHTPGRTGWDGWYFEASLDWGTVLTIEFSHGIPQFQKGEVSYEKRNRAGASANSKDCFRAEKLASHLNICVDKEEWSQVKDEAPVRKS